MKQNSKKYKEIFASVLDSITAQNTAGSNPILYLQGIEQATVYHIGYFYDLR